MIATAAIAVLSAFTFIVSDRVDIHNGIIPAPGPNRCVRLHATGTFDRATVRVNDVNAGELANRNSELDITGYLSTGAPNRVELHTGRGAIDRVWAWMSPLVYIASAQLDSQTGLLEVTVVNTTENTAQVELRGGGGDAQFTVSPGTSAARQIPWSATAPRRIRMRAVSDGLDRDFSDEADIETVERR